MTRADVAELFRQRFRREVRQGTYVMHFAALGRGGVGEAGGRDRADADRDPVGHQHAGHGRAGVASRDQGERCPDLPVMMVTAYGDDERRRRGRGVRRCEFLTKPVDFDLLKAQLRQLQTTASNPSS